MVSLLVTYVLLVVGGITVSIPFVWMISTSFKTLGQTFVFPPEWIPNPWVWENYVSVFQTGAVPFQLFYRNTAFITITSVLGLLLSSSLAAFAFARLRWRGKNVLFVIVLSTMMLPPQVTMIPRFIIFRRLDWIDTYKPLIIPACLGTAFQIFLFRQFFQTIPLEMDEAARIDGASSLGIYWRIILPLSQPALMTGAIFAFQYRWNQFLEPLMYLNSQKKFTLALGLRLFQDNYATDWNKLMAASTLAMLPVLIVFYFGQRRFIQGVVVSGVKG
jgi:ABC-type glycerol-3-phosphate transport system permease component